MSISEQQQAAPTVRQPCFRVRANGIDLTGVTEVEVDSNSHFAADTFSFTAALSGLPVALNENYWSQTDRDVIQIDFGFRDSTGAPSFVNPFSMTGTVDDVLVDKEQQTLHLSGRDFSGDLIDTKIANINSNQSASLIAANIAKEHGLIANIAPTSIKNGKIFQQNHVRLSQEQSEWDLLIYLAQQEGFDLWVSAQGSKGVLNFQPPVAATADPYMVTWSNNSANVKNLRLRRSQTLARDVIVKVRSWNQAQGKTFIGTATLSRAYKSDRGSTPQTYVFNVPNLDQGQANAWALSKAKEITRHERVISAEMPGDNLLSNRSLIKLVGTKTTWDQVYYVDTVHRRMSMAGYFMETSAKNHSTESTLSQ